MKIIHNVTKYTKEEDEFNTAAIPLKSVRERVVAAASISRNTYERIQKEARNMGIGDGSTFGTPLKQHSKASRK